MRAFVVLALGACNMGAPSRPPGDAAAAAAVVVSRPELVRGSVAVDDDHACAIEATGKVACWGHGDWTAALIPGLDDATVVAAGQSLTCALTAHGAVSCWEPGARPRRVPDLDNIVQLSVGIDSACGLRASGRVACWSADRASDDPGLTDVVEIAGAYSNGAELFCARLKSGAVTCGNHSRPFEAIPALAGATSLGGAGARFAVLLPGHRLARWVGWTGYPMPEFVDGVDGDRVIVGGHLNGDDEICVLGAYARCWMWSGEPSLRLSAAMSLPAGVRDLSIDTEATCARIADHVECWGRVGRLGDGDAEYPSAFVPVKGITDARQLDAIGHTMCALRDTGRVACWGERLASPDELTTARAIDREPVELPGVTDAVEIAMEGGDLGDGTAVAVAVCARRKTGATCWSIKHDAIEASDAPELASADKLYSGPAVCGVSAHDAVRCVRLDPNEGSIPGFSEDDYERIVYQDPKHEGVRRITRVLETRLHHALVSNRQPDGFHSADARDTGERFRADAPRPPIDTQADVGEVRRIEWTTSWDRDRVRGVRCARHGATIACWGERDYLGAGQRSTRGTPVTVTGVVMGH